MAEEIFTASEIYCQSSMMWRFYDVRGFMTSEVDDGDGG
jgi:hypothetical protein